MSNDADRPPRYVHPRPEVVKTLGVMNIVVSILVSMCVSLSMMLFVLILSVTPKTIEVPIPSNSPTPAATTPANTSTPPADGSASTPPSADGPASTPAPAPPKQTIVGSTFSMSPMMGMDEPAFVKFCVIDLVTALVVNMAMFASGIGLVKLKRWGALWSNWTAGIKIVRLVALWVGFIVLVAPPLSMAVAKLLVKIMASSNATGPVPDVKLFAQAYMLTYTIMAVIMILIGVIYPVITLVIATRPGFLAALRRDTSMKSSTPEGA